jgi:alpha-D-ribose 1-methylphosphonate 5-triphosphate synthase subunit PhnG
MERNERFQITAVADKEPLCRLADEVVGDSQVTLIKGPCYGMIMMRVRDTVDNDIFNLGEVLVTEAEVKVNGFSGYCMVMGREMEKALAGAVIDAAVEARHRLSHQIIGALEQEKCRLEAARKQEWNEVSRTKANFEVMQQ